jgi:glutathione reductase (NADPH)
VRYDLVVIGAGSGGVRAARMSASYGAKVAIIEEFRVGGTCVIRGCVPKKLYVYASRFRDLFEVAPSFGWHVEATFDWPTLVANKEKEISRLEKAYVSGLEGSGVEIIRDRAEIVDANSVRTVKGRQVLNTRYILVATGGHAVIPEMPGRELAFTSSEAFDLPKLPHSILIVGGGYVAVEFATIFAGLGVHTTVVCRGNNILRGFDEDLRQGLDMGLESRGIQRVYETTVRSLHKQGGDIVADFSDGTDAPYGAVLFATGRNPNVNGYGLQDAGVKLRPDGAIEVDAYSKTSVPSIYAVGDVTGRDALTPVAIRDGAAVAATLFNNTPTAVDHSLIGTAVFAEPELATIGLTEGEAVTHGDIDVYVTRFRPMLHTLSTKSDRMMLKLITLAEDQRVVGLHILGPGAAEMVQLAAVAIGMKATKADLDRTFAMHPTAGEELVTFKAPSYRYRGGRKQ